MLGDKFNNNFFNFKIIKKQKRNKRKNRKNCGQPKKLKKKFFTKFYKI